MKKLQNNYTTPEQSKILLELGLPADSADLVFMKGYSRCGEDEFVIPFYKTDSLVTFFKNREWKDGSDFIPCWSAGRLMEIHDICIEDEDAQYGWAPTGDYNYIDYIISRFEDEIIYFFKLEK